MKIVPAARVKTYAALTVAYLAVMLWLTVMPLNELGGMSSTMYLYFIHALEFFILAVLLFGMLSSFGLRHPYMVTLLLILAIGMLTEALQLFVPHRSFSLLDLGSDFFGGLFILVRKVV